MRKILALILVFLMLTSIAYAAKGSSPSKGKEKTEIKKTEKTEKVKEPKKAKTTKELKDMSSKKKKELEEEAEKMKGPKKEVYKNQNRIRLAVHNLQAMEGMLGGIGPEVSKIAREFNNSVKTTTQAEIKIKERSGFTRFFRGGDEESAETIEKEVNKDEQLIENLEEKVNKANLAEEVRTKADEQIKSIRSELERLKKVAAEEK